jgi:hypothetical protein
MISGFGDFTKQVLLHFRQIEVFRYQLLYTFRVPGLFCGDKLMANLQDPVRNSHRTEREQAVFGLVLNFIDHLADLAMWLRHHQNGQKVVQDLILTG